MALLADISSGIKRHVMARHHLSPCRDRHSSQAADQLPENVIDAYDQFFTSSIFELVKGLPLPQREVVVLCAVLGFDYETAATSLQIPIGTVRSRLARAREQLGKQLDDALAV
jgi:DNA-directed RNA polymerase specialized sigma24 family protein